MRLSKSKLCTHNLHTDINTGLIEKKTGFSGRAKEGALHNQLKDLTPKICISILHTACHTLLMILALSVVSNVNNRLDYNFFSSVF